MSAAQRVITAICALGGTGLLMSCTSSPSLPDVAAPAPPHAYTIAAQERGAMLAFVTCSDCPKPTPKSLPASRSSLAAAMPAPPAPRALVPAIRTEHFTLVFDINSAGLSPQARSRVAALVPLARSARRVRITGYTDDLGSQALNARLSDGRAVAVMVALRDALGEPGPELTASGRPLCCYLTDNRNENHRAPNRRVEVALELPDTPTVARLVQAAREHAVGGKSGATSTRRNAASATVAESGRKQPAAGAEARP